MFDAWLRRAICCPTDKSVLTESGDELVCESGHRFPVVDGIPVLISDVIEPTFHVTKKSLEAARNQNSWKKDPLFLSTVGIDEDQRIAIKRGHQCENEKIDPVVSYLVAHTSGMMYKHMVGHLKSYPIPDIDLPMSNGAYFVDIGCSWGRWCIAAAQKGYCAVGIDPSLGAVLAGRRVAQRMGFDIKWLVGDARQLPFKDSAFDVVHSYSVFQHFKIEDVNTSVAEVSRVIKQNGMTKIQLANRYGMRSLYHQARRGFRPAKNFEVRYLSPSTMRALFVSAGFDVELTTDCYFGLGLQKADVKFMPWNKRAMLTVSEALKKLSIYVRPLRLVADSICIIGSHHATKSKLGPLA